MNNKYRYASEVAPYKISLNLPPEFKPRLETVKKHTGKSFNLQTQEALKHYLLAQELLIVAEIKNRKKKGD